ncbi:mitotic-spindle organizing gamma-tubulin ring associated-domain-containing protein [Entophlyctis helioformis]|nr:mitotic-spindle organizing gamma-tubulin ring associated-domain-containing protein [Entophlyctis helioformis]
MSQQQQQQHSQQHSQQQSQQQAAGRQLMGQAQETMDILFELSVLLNTGLDRDALSLCVSLCESGVNPEALAAVIKELKRESRSLAAAASSSPLDPVAVAGPIIQ